MCRMNKTKKGKSVGGGEKKSQSGNLLHLQLSHQLLLLLLILLAFQKVVLAGLQRAAMLAQSLWVVRGEKTFGCA